MKNGIKPQYIKSEKGPKRLLSKKTQIETEIPVIKHWLESDFSKLNYNAEASAILPIERISFRPEVPQEVKDRLKTAFALDFSENPEAHIIEVKGQEINVWALSERGLFYGGISLTHLMENGEVEELLAYDTPVCKERGMKVFLPSTETMDYFKKFVDMICYFKFNHIMIEVGGAMEYKKHPEINEGWVEYCKEMGEYSGKTTKIQDHTYPWYKNAIHMENGDGKYLKQEEVRDLVAYCRERMIEVIPEVPSLGHCDYLMLGHMDIAERPEDPYADTYCPSNPASYELLFDILEEVIDVFEPKVINIGHDEYYTIGVCDKCKGKSGAEIFAGDVIKIYEYLASKGVKTMLWGDKLLKNAVVPDAGPFGGAEIQMYSPAFNRKEGKPIGIMPATYQAIDMIPKDILILHWNWSLGEHLEDEFLDKGWDIRYGNFEGYYFDNWKEHIQKSNYNGAFISNWSSVNEIILQRNSIFFGISYSYDMFWNHNYKDSDFESLRDKTFSYLFEYKFGKELELPQSQEISSHPSYIQLDFATDYFVKFKFFVDGVFPEKEVYEIGEVIFEYGDGSKASVPVVYGYNIGNINVSWKRIQKDDRGYNNGYQMDDHLLEMAMNTLPVLEGDKTYYRHIIKNPHPDKELVKADAVPYQDKKCKIYSKGVTYLG